MAYDIAHMVGNVKVIRAVNVLFAFFWIRDTIWMKAKNSALLRECKLHFGMDLMQMEKKRSLLWPLIEQACKKDNKQPNYME